MTEQEVTGKKKTQTHPRPCLICDEAVPPPKSQGRGETQFLEKQLFVTLR